AAPDVVPCRLCGARVARDATACPSCGVKASWIPDEPGIDPRWLRVALWGGGIVGLVLLLVVFGILMFGPAAEDTEPGPPIIGDRRRGATQEDGTHRPRNGAGGR